MAFLTVSVDTEQSRRLEKVEQVFRQAWTNHRKKMFVTTVV